MNEQTGASMTAETFRRAMALRETTPEVFDLAFEADTQYVPWPKAYGGDMVAQSAAAAMRSVTDGKVLHSMHSYFLRPADIGAAVRYEVEIVRDGRGYSTRQVRGFQNGKPIYLCIASFHLPEEGAEYAPEMPEVPGPETLPSAAEYLGAAGADLAAEPAAYWAHGRSFDMRHVPGPVYLEVEGEPVAHQAVWVRAFDALADDPDLHRAAVAYVCDYTILEPVLRRIGIAWATPGLVTASLDHSLWFHRPARADGWLLYAQEAASIQSGRGLGLGRFYTREGELVATVAQEGMIRPPRG